MDQLRQPSMPAHEQAEYDRTWQRHAAEGEVIKAAGIYRSLYEVGLLDAKRAVEAYRENLPESERLQAIELSPGEAAEELLSLEPHFANLFDRNRARVLHKALSEVTSFVRRRVEPKVVITGPRPPKPQYAGHHWLAVHDSDGHFHGYQVMFWQPGAQTWCHSGNHAAYADVNTEYWKYVAECPMPK